MIVIHVSSGARWLLSVQYCAQTTPCTAQQKRLLMDISHRLRSAIGQLTLQKDLEQTVQRVEMASQAKGDFLATMSHELRTPLHGVIGLLALLDTERERLSLDQQTNLLLAQSSAHVLSSLIDDVLDLSKIEAGKVELQDKAFDVEKTLRSALVPFVMKAREKDLELQLELQNVAKTLIGDELRLRQVLLNLVGNALKFTQQGFVRITTWQAQGQWHITIEDSGIGIAVEKQESLFNPFVQVHDMEVLGENLQEKGTGLGTTIAKHFVEMMGGSISVKSELGKGAIFHIHLPLREADAERTSLCLTTHDLVVQRKKQRVDVSGVQGAAHKLSVLVAEDDPIGRKIAEKQLKRAGFSVIAVADGLQALAQVKEKPFDLLLTDVRMPGMNGMELAKMVRQYEEETGKKRMFIMGLSAHALEEVKNEALAHGMDDFISKPVDMQALMEKLERSGSEAVAEDA